MSFDYYGHFKIDDLVKSCKCMHYSNLSFLWNHIDTKSTFDYVALSS